MFPGDYFESYDGSTDSSLVRAPVSWSKGGRGFESPQSGGGFLVLSRVKFLPVLTLIFGIRYRSSTQKIPVILPKVQTLGYS